MVVSGSNGGKVCGGMEGRGRGGRMEGMEGRRRLLTGLAGAGQSSPRAAPPLSRRPQEAPRGLSEEAQGAQEPYTPMGNQANQPKSQIDLKGSSHIDL